MPTSEARRRLERPGLSPDSSSLRPPEPGGFFAGRRVRATISGPMMSREAGPHIGQMTYLFWRRVFFTWLTTRLHVLSAGGRSCHSDRFENPRLERPKERLGMVRDSELGLEAVKVLIDPKSRLASQQNGATKPQFINAYDQNPRSRRPLAIFQAVSKLDFSH
jgi:hypothetical protein